MRLHIINYVDYIIYLRVYFYLFIILKITVVFLISLSILIIHFSKKKIVIQKVRLYMINTSSVHYYSLKDMESLN